MRQSWTLTVAIAILIMAAGCSGATVQPPAPQAPGPGDKAPSAAGWEQKWQTTLAEAKREGIVRVYTNWGAQTRSSLSQTFKERYGIELEFTPFARGADMLARHQAETRAGLNVVDVFGTGATTFVTMMKPEGVLRPIEPLLILPDVLDPAAWRENRFPFVDRDRLIIGMISSLQRQIAYNTDMIKEGEITTYKDLLKPQYKGKIAMADPTLTGTANALFSHLALQLWNLEEASDFLRRLIREQEVVIQREHRIVVEWVARGKYPIGLSGQQETVAEFLKMGAPMTLVIQKEGHPVDVAAGALGLPLVSPHPNAAAVFVNWILTREGQTLFAIKGYGSPSRRLDVSTEGIHPLFVPKPGEKLFDSDEDNIAARGKMMDLARKIIEETR